MQDHPVVCAQNRTDDDNAASGGETPRDQQLAREEAVARLQSAQAALQAAEREYRRLEQEGSHPAIREALHTMNELTGTALALVRQHPAAGVIGAAAVGFFLGRLFRR